MSKITISLKKDLNTEIVNESGTKIRTAPPSKEGECFSPTDLFASSLGACMLTLMAIAAEKIQFDLEGTTVDVEKVMASEPIRHIAKMIVRIRVPKTANQEQREKLEKAALNCPVKVSMSEKVGFAFDFIWGI